MVTPSPPAPQRGDVIYVDFTLKTAGHEQAGYRPGLVLTPHQYNDNTGMAIVCPITNQKKGYPFEVDIPEGHDVKGVIMANHIRNIDWRARHATIEAHLPDRVVRQTIKMVGRLLNPNQPP